MEDEDCVQLRQVKRDAVQRLRAGGLMIEHLYKGEARLPPEDRVEEDGGPREWHEADLPAEWGGCPFRLPLRSSSDGKFSDEDGCPGGSLPPPSLAVSIAEPRRCGVGGGPAERTVAYSNQTLLMSCAFRHKYGERRVGCLTDLGLDAPLAVSTCCLRPVCGNCAGMALRSGHCAECDGKFGYREGGDLDRATADARLGAEPRGVEWGNAAFVYWLRVPCGEVGLESWQGKSSCRSG